MTVPYGTYGNDRGIGGVIDSRATTQRLTVVVSAVVRDNARHNWAHRDQDLFGAGFIIERGGCFRDVPGG